MAGAVVMLLSLMLSGAYADLRSEIEDASARFTEAFNRQDAEVVSQLYTEDCALMPTGVDIINGRKNVKKTYEQYFKNGMASVAIKIDDVGPPDATDTLYERSHLTFFNTEGKIIDKAKHMVIWKKIFGGEWRLHTHSYSTTTSPTQLQKEDVLKEEILVLNNRFSELWGKNDARGLAASCYTSDGMILETGFDVIKGEAMAPFLQILFDLGLSGISITQQDVNYLGASEDMAYERGIFTVTDPKGNFVTAGRFIFILKKVDGQWKIYVDFCNSDPVGPADSSEGHREHEL